MAVESSFWIRCEVCACRVRLRPDRSTPIIQFAEPRILVRASASELGWTVDALGRDLCPYCSVHSGPDPSGHRGPGGRHGDTGGPCPLCVPVVDAAEGEVRHNAFG